MNHEQFPIALLGQTFTREQQIRKLRGYKEGSLRSREWAFALKRAHDSGAFATCLCLEPEENKRRLAVKKSPNGLYHLARFPGTEQEHLPNCLYANADGKRPALEPENQVVNLQETVETKTHYSADCDDPFSPQAMRDLSVIELEALQQPAFKVSFGENDSKPQMLPFSEILPAMWASAGMTTHDGSHITRNTAAGQLQRAAKGIAINGRFIDNTLLLFTSEGYEKRKGTNRLAVESAIAIGDGLWMISFLSKYDPEKHERPGLYPISGFHGMPYFIISKDDWSGLLQKYPIATSAWKHGYTVATLVRAELQPTQNNLSRVQASVVEASLMVVTNSMIPAFSAAEYALAGQLSVAGRRFQKMLPKDSAKAIYLTHTPQFILTDTGRRDTPLVLFEGKENATQALERKTYFSNLYPQNGAWWSWKVGTALGENIPQACASEQSKCCGLGSCTCMLQVERSV